MDIQLILVVVILLVVAIFGVYKIVTLPTKNRKEQIKKVALSLVILAEREFGSNSGKVKLAYVYSELTVKLPYLRYVPFSVVEKLIDETLIEMKRLINEVPDIKKFVEKDGE